MPTLDEYRRQRPIAPRQVDTQRLKGLVQDSVRMDALTNDENWDYFLRYLESAIKMTERMRDEEMQKLRDPELVNDDAVRACRAALSVMDARIAVLKEVITMPKLLKEHGALARAQLEDLAPGA